MSKFDHFRFLARRMLMLGAFLTLGGALSGCVGAALVAGGTTGYMVAQERTVGDGIDDISMDLQIQDRMRQQDGADLGRVNVSVNEGRVLLTGLVHTPEDRVAAARATWSHPRGKEVINEIEISSLSEWKRVPKDTWISNQIRAKVIFDGEVAGRNYDIEVVDGTVYLLGVAENQYELERAVDHARNVRGVKKVVSHVHLKDGRERQELVLGQR